MKKIKRMLPVIMACFVLAGCGGSKELKGVCNSFMESYTTGDSQTVASFFGISEDEAEMGEIQRALAEKISIKTEKAKKKGETAVVTTVITAPDLKQLLDALPEEIDSTEAAKEALLTAVKAEDVPVKEFSVEIQLEQNEDEKWQIRMTTELADALLGGYYSIMSEMMEGMAE